MSERSEDDPVDSGRAPDAPQRDPGQDGRSERDHALGFLHLVERLFLAIIVMLTLAGAAIEVASTYRGRSVDLADILLMFLYLEVIGMVAVYYADRRSVFVYPIFIAITALTRLVILQGKDMRPENILFESLSILLLAAAAVVIARVHPPRTA
ncbi:MAG: phosphate-starvation-inducible PsiE family protein [Pseudomonadales bacterium]|jgi:protein PsiE|nr:phosphate-starvation-inducible PsiE family protein [Pseudomonadales bacterium]